MWKEYSASYIKNNRSTGISVMAASFIAALFLSFLCSLFYNFWQDNIAGIIQEEGDWQARISGAVQKEDVDLIQNHANVKEAVFQEASSEYHRNSEYQEDSEYHGNSKYQEDSKYQGISKIQENTVELWFYNARDIYPDMQSILELLGLPEDAADYHYQLLSLYFIRIPGDNKPRLILPFYLAVVLVVCLSMILVIHNSFALSMNSRLHQFGIFSSIGAAPGQIRVCLMQEAAALALPPVLCGILLGIFLSFATVWAMLKLSRRMAGARSISFQYHPAVFGITLLVCVLTVLISAWMPARKLSRITPLEAIRGTDGPELKRKASSPVLAALFGFEGELAGNALKAQKKALRTTSLSLTLSFLGFMVMQCFFTLSDISTDHTYFKKYQNAWDIMATVKNTNLQELAFLEDLQALPGIESCVAYQKSEALCRLPQDAFSPELASLGGPEALAGSAVSAGKNGCRIKAPIVVLDDAGFLEYCRQIGAPARLDGTVVLNRIWDSVHSNFRSRSYVPYLTEDQGSLTLCSTADEENCMEIPVTAYTQECPVLREEYGDSENGVLVQFLPLSLWKELHGTIGGTEKDLYIRVLAENRTDVDALHALEQEMEELLGQRYELEMENRIQEKLDNDAILHGYKLVLGSFCILLAIIGIANVFSNTLGFLRQRKREFARYLSVGLTPEGVRKIFCIEALTIAGRPLLTTLLLTAALTYAMIKASYLDPAEFLAKVPAVPILAFILAVSGFVALAYYLGGKKILRLNLAEALRDDTML